MADHETTISLAPIVRLDVPGHTSMLVVVTEPIEIGREGTGIVAVDPLVSRRHLRLEPRGDRLMVVDLGSMNGVRVDGVSIIGPHALAVGEVAEFGRSRLTLVTTAADARSVDRPRVTVASAVPVPSAVVVVMPESAMRGDSSSYRTIVARITDRHGGQIVRQLGDLFVVRFADGRDGMAAAEALQRGFEAHARSQPAAAVRVNTVVTVTDGSIEAVHPP